MYKVFVADDEIVIREGLRNNFPWEDNGFTLVGEAPDGEIALPMIRDEKPDILITDIRMPFMDGIALCREVRRVMPWIQIVILSGFDSFEYAKQAITLGVQDYLLKPISSDELKQVLSRITERIEKEQRERSNLEKLREQMQTGKLLVRDQIISNAINVGITEAEGERSCAQMRSFGINLNSARYLVIEFRSAGGSGHYGEMHVALMQLLERTCDTVFMCSGDTFLNALVLGDSEQDIEERAYSFARSALDELDRVGYHEVRAAIGESVEHFWEVSASYKTARHSRHLAENAHQPLRMRRIIGVRDVREPVKRPDAQTMEIQPLYDRMKYAGLDDYREQLNSYVESLRSVSAAIPLDGSYLRAEVLMTAFRIVQEAEGDPRKVLTTPWMDDTVSGLEDLDSCVAEADRVLCQAITFRESKGTYKGNPVVNKARKYLEENFTNPNLTFNDVVDYVAMSSSHFSTLFSQTMGVTFTKYLINLRMGKAKELLTNTSMRSSEIAYAVGYNDPHYFSYLFKKNVGVTPSEFRSGEASEESEPEE